jgi:uncharacterized protein (DUF1330 family)
MSAYLIARVDVQDWDRYREYMRHTPRVIANFGGRFIVRGGETITVEGPQETRRLVVIEFPSFSQAKAFYESGEYRRIKEFRDGAGAAQFVIVDGYSLDDWNKVAAESAMLRIPD